MKTRTKVGLIIMASIIAILGVAVYIYYFTASYPAFEAISTKEFKIPGLETKFVPQGIDYDQSNQKFLVSGYMSNGSASRIYIINNQTDETEKHFTLTVDGEDYKGHSSGIAIDGGYGWLAGDGYVYRFNYSEALTLENGSKLEVMDYFQTGNGADFILTYNNKLIVGEFHNGKKYIADESHKVETETETNYALAFIYNINQSSPYGIESTTPVSGLSLPNKVQGMNFTKDGNIILSTSYSIPSSSLLVYENVLEQPATSSVTLDEQTLPVYVLSSSNKTQTLKAPAMSEELVLVEDKVYLLFESNCSKYRLFNRTRLSNVYALDI